MVGRMGWVTVVMISGAFMTTSCSSGPNLVQDQATVNQLQARVSSDHQATVDAEYKYGAVQGTQPTSCCYQSAPSSMIVHDHALLSQAATRLQKDRFNLQVAQDQLKKDESSG